MATIDLSAYEPTPGQTSDATAISNAFVAIQNAVNALDNSNIAAGANIAVSKLSLPGGSTNFLREDGTWTTPSSGAGVPSGVVSEYAGASAPSGWLLCDGAAVSRTTYAALFTAIGTAYGAGNGSTTFNVPDLQGRVPVGKGTHTDVSTLANSDGTSLANRRPRHRHDVYDPQHTHGIPSGGDGYVVHKAGGTDDVGGSGTAAEGSIPNASTGIKVNPGGVSSDTTSPLNAPAYLVVNYIIKQ